jgi:hypothetical protein
MSASRLRLASFMLLLAGWILVSAIVNFVGWTVDRLDRTGAF